MEERLDEDFRFYLTFTKVFFGNLIDKNEAELCQTWLTKLCSEDVTGVAAKRSRNIYLSQLILAMQDGKLRGPFQQPPPSGVLPPSTIFGPEQPPVVEPPKWLAEVVQGCGGDVSRTSRDGRTYLATRNLGQRGAFGCVAINMEQPEPQWIHSSGGTDDGKSPPDVCDAANATVDEADPQPLRSVRLPGGGSLHDVSVRLAGGSDAIATGELRFSSPIRRSRVRAESPTAARMRSPATSPVRRANSARSPGLRRASPDGRWFLPPSARDLGEAESEGAVGRGSPLGQPVFLQNAPGRSGNMDVALEGKPRGTSATRTRSPARTSAAIEAFGRMTEANNCVDAGAEGEGPWLGPATSSSLQTGTSQAANGALCSSDMSLENMPPLQILDNIRHMLSMRPGPEDRQKVLEFYHGLIENVDAVWKGKTAPLPEIESLLGKIRHDLKGMLAPLDPEQHSKTILIILRDKLVRRIKEVHERERKLDCAEKLLSVPPEEASNTSLKIPSPLSDVLWNEAIHQTPKRPNLIKLQGTYDETLVDKFINLLALEKGKIIEIHKRQYEKSVQCMKQKLQDNIGDAVNAYIVAREDWAEVSCLLENVQNAQIEAALSKSGKEPPSKEHWKVINQLMDQIKESQGHYENEIQRGEDLRMLLVAEHQSNHLVKLIASNNMQQLKNDNSELQDTIQQLELEIKNQQERIDELRSLLQEKFPATLNSE